MKINIVLGAGFGDEGKGQCVHALSGPDTLVVRFSGGHQCGHTVVSQPGVKHIFSQLGAGTFRGAATYISEYCTVFPVGLFNEYKAFQVHNADISGYYVHPMAFVTTPYDLAFNRAVSIVNRHGTCGVGFGTTIQRNEDYYNLFVLDLQTPYVYDTKLKLIRKYYEDKVTRLNMNSQITYEEELEAAMENWEESVDFYRRFIRIASFNEIVFNYKEVVFEGSQGILLDQHFGFFPHVTRSHTTSLQAMKIIEESPLVNPFIQTNYISRCYQTRHGNGPFSDETVELINTESESNLENDWQGTFRTASLDFSLVEHAIRCDGIRNFSKNKRLVFTCLDQLKDPDSFVLGLKKHEFFRLVQKTDFKSAPDWDLSAAEN